MDSSRRPKTAFFILLFLFFFNSSQAQDKTPEDDRRTTADESFSLNITESRASESNYRRTTSVELNEADDKGVLVRVGAMVRAQNIVITLRGITGNVRFRASLEKIRRLIE